MKNWERDLAQWLWLHTSNAGGLGSILGRGTRYHMPPPRVHMLQLKISPTSTKTWWNWSCSVVSDSLQPHGLSLPGSSVHEIFQAGVLEWAATSFSRGSSRPRDRTQVSGIVDRCFSVWATREGLVKVLINPKDFKLESCLSGSKNLVGETRLVCRLPYN